MSVINIPITIPDELWTNALVKDYEEKVTIRLTEEVRKVLCDHDNYYYRNSKNPERGIENWVSTKIDDILKEYKDEIIKTAADKLAERLARTKKAKELIDGQKTEK